MPPAALGIRFFLWVGIFNLMVHAQFWSFANDLYTPEQGKRLFAIVGFGAIAGRPSRARRDRVGALIRRLRRVPADARRRRACCCVFLVLTNVVNARESGRAAARSGRQRRDSRSARRAASSSCSSTDTCC